jgi:hypothetical protein
MFEYFPRQPELANLLRNCLENPSPGEAASKTHKDTDNFCHVVK